jgi:UDP-N-acetylglucosamine 2-epimerase
MMQLYLQKGSYGNQTYFAADTFDTFNQCYYKTEGNRRGLGFDKPQLPGTTGPTCGCASASSFGHTGFTGTMTWADPEHELIYVFLSNRTYPDATENKLAKENIINGVHVVGNTIVEVVQKYKPNEEKLNDCIILDIHRPENFKYKNRLKNIIIFANDMSKKHNVPVYMLGFPRTISKLKEYGIDLGNILVIDLLPFKAYLTAVYNCKFLISDSGTAQEEPAILGTPVIVPRDFTERPESVSSNCSFMLDVNTINTTWEDSQEWLKNNAETRQIEWLGDGNTANKIIEILKRDL